MDWMKRKREAIAAVGARLQRTLGSDWGRRALASMLGLALVVSLMPASVSAADPSSGGRIDAHVRQLATLKPNGTIPVLVHRSSKNVAQLAVTKHGGKERRRLGTGNAIAGEIPAAKLQLIAQEPGVTRISLDAPVKSQGVLEALESSISWSGPEDALSASALKTAYPLAVRANELWSANPAIQGSRVTVAVVDSGLRDHGDFDGADRTGNNPSGRSRIVKRVAIASDASGPNDDNGHGTFVAGVIGGRGWAARGPADDGQYVGIAPDVNLIGVKVGNQDGAARVSDVIGGIEWVIANQKTHNIRVLNLSLLSTVAESYKTSPLDAAVELAWLKGIVVVVSAGNTGPNSMVYPPANDPFVITVGGTDDLGTASIADDQRLSYSGYGTTQDGFSKPEMGAPGRRIYSTLASPKATLAQLFPGRVTGDRLYIRLSGTSAAAPVVSGVVAQLLQARPKLTPGQVKWLLRATARPMPGQNLGSGYPDAVAAVSFTGSIGNRNSGIVPSLAVARAGYLALHGTNVSWDNVSWDNVSWDNVSWDNVSWDNVSWDNVSWDNVSWDNVSWDNVSWDNVSWDNVSWDNVSWD